MRALIAQLSRYLWTVPGAGMAATVVRYVGAYTPGGIVRRRVRRFARRLVLWAALLVFCIVAF